MKWSGSKDSQSDEIISYIPNDIKNYYEPFVGGGSMFLKLLEMDNKIENYYISDYNEDLINIYKMIQDDPKHLISEYEQHYQKFNLDENTIDNRKLYFNKVREKYNRERDASDFYWIMRTTTNGMPRYNRNLEFNNSCHFSRPGMRPDKVADIINKYSKLFSEKNVIFQYINYLEVEVDGFLYCDPPYENTKGMYFSNFNNKEFIQWINKQEQWILSYDGKVNLDKVEHSEPKYLRHKYLKSGNSSFRRVIGNSKDSIVYESLYLSY